MEGDYDYRQTNTTTLAINSFSFSQMSKLGTQLALEKSDNTCGLSDATNTKPLAKSSINKKPKRRQHREICKVAGASQ